MKKIVGIFAICVILLIGCSNKDVSTESQKENVPFLGTWTVYSINAGSGKDTLMAEVLEEGKYKTSDIYNFNSDGSITSKTNIFGISKFSWESKDGKYILDAEASPADIEYKDNELTIRLNTTTLHLVKGEKSAEELLKDAGLYHVDELQIVNNSITSLGNGFFKIVYEIKNSSTETVVFKGISIEERDVNNSILKSYYSYNKNATTLELLSGESGKLELTFSENDEINTVISTKYTYTMREGKNIAGSFSTPYTVEVR